MNEPFDSSQKPAPTPAPAGAPGGSTGTMAGTTTAGTTTVDTSAAGTSAAGPRQDYSSSAGDEPDFAGTAASLDSLPVGEAMHEMVDLVRQFVREHPLASVAGGVLVGMVLGRR